MGQKLSQKLGQKPDQKLGEKLSNLLVVAFILFLVASFLFGYQPGQGIAFNLRDFLMEMAKIVPCAFILIGLFEVWIKRETVEKHLGEDSGLQGHLWGLVLATTTVGGAYVAFPVAYSLYKKGAGLGVIFTYIGAASLVRVPMTIFEASFLGVKFSLVRLFVSLPLILVTAHFFGRYLQTKGYQMPGTAEPDKAEAD